MVRRVLAGGAARRDSSTQRELELIPFPDLLQAEPGPGPDPKALANLLDLAFLGRASAGELDAELDGMEVKGSVWDSQHFARDLFLAELVRGTFDIRALGHRYSVHQQFLERVLSCPPTDGRTVRFRQAILEELDALDALREATEELLARIRALLALLRASRDDARLEPVRFRLDVLRSFRAVVDQMADEFVSASSGLERLHETGDSIRASSAYRRMEDLLDHNDSMSYMRLLTVIDSRGRLRHVEIEGVTERKGNPFYRRPIRRWWDRLRMLFRRYRFDPEELVDQLVQDTYQNVAPAMVRVVQLGCHLEVYLASRGFASNARARGLEVSLPEVDPGVELELSGLFNPLLMQLMDRPVPTDLKMATLSPITIVTGPNSGGKTRLLQAIGLAQVLGQSGLYAPCARGRLPLVDDLFASIVEVDRADQSEGRLGTELVRLRTLFERVPPGSLVLLDELVSGTNPSEAIEIVDVVLRLLRRLGPVAFVTTHFLDFAERLNAEPSVSELCFLQAEVDDKEGATYRFIDGIASTSLAVGTAERLGVTFDELERRLRARIEEPEPSSSPGS
jgi:DNA mismatch repair protein MutS2